MILIVAIFRVFRFFIFVNSEENIDLCLHEVHQEFYCFNKIWYVHQESSTLVEMISLKFI